MIIWIMVAIFGVLSIVFLMGKGSFLIAGYNTSSAKEKAKYDEKKLCLVMGIGMLILTLALVLMAVLEEDSLMISTIIMIGAVLFIVIGSNTLCLNKEHIQETTEKKGWIKKDGRLSMIFSIVVCAVVAVMLFTGEIKIEMSDQHITAGSSGILSQSTEVLFDDIVSINYTSDIDLGNRSFGIGSPSIQSGNFKNEEFGNYKLYSYTSCHDYVVIETKQEYVVMNDKDEEKTKELYQNILLKLKK